MSPPKPAMRRSRAQRPAGVARASVPRGQGREALCAALVRIVAREGLDGVTFRSVAAEAGVTHGLASYHFGTRERMIREALEWASHRAIALSHLDAAVDRLEALGTATPTVIANAPHEAAFQYQLALEALRRPGLRAGVRASYDAYIAAVAQSLGSLGLGGEPALATLVFAALDGVALQQLIYEDEHRSSAAIVALHRLLRAYREQTAP